MRDTVGNASRDPIARPVRTLARPTRGAALCRGPVPSRSHRLVPERASDAWLFRPRLLLNRLQHRAKLLHGELGCPMRGRSQPALPAVRLRERRQLLLRAQHACVQQCHLLRARMRRGPVLLPSDVGHHVRAWRHEPVRWRKRHLRRSWRRGVHPAAPHPCMQRCGVLQRGVRGRPLVLLPVVGSVLRECGCRRMRERLRAHVPARGW